MDFDYGHFDYTCWAVQLHVGVARVEDTDKFVDENLVCYSRGASAIMPRIPTLRSLLLAWVRFSLAFSTVFGAFLTSCLIDSGYITPIHNMDKLFTAACQTFEIQFRF
jgi:hypothetical protein